MGVGRGWSKASGPLLVPSSRSSASTTEPKLPNPDPTNYKVVKAEQVGTFLVLKINYPDCTNYEGNKILVFRGLTPIDLLNQRVIDPHFFEDKKVASPIARFVPTDEGWKMAVNFADMMLKHSKEGVSR